MQEKFVTQIYKISGSTKDEIQKPNVNNNLLVLGRINHSKNHFNLNFAKRYSFKEFEDSDNLTKERNKQTSYSSILAVFL